MKMIAKKRRNKLVSKKGLDIIKLKLNKLSNIHDAATKPWVASRMWLYPILFSDPSVSKYSVMLNLGKMLKQDREEKIDKEKNWWRLDRPTHI